jgi:hypothetical protein
VAGHRHADRRLGGDPGDYCALLHLGDVMTVSVLRHAVRFTSAVVFSSACCCLGLAAQTAGGGVITYQMDVPQGGMAILRYSVRGSSMRIDMFKTPRKLPTK